MRFRSFSFFSSSLCFRLIVNYSGQIHSLGVHNHIQLVKPFGLEADRHLLRCLFSSIDFSDPSQTAKQSLQAKLLNQELNAVLNKSSLITNICFAIDNCFAQQKVSVCICVCCNRSVCIGRQHVTLDSTPHAKHHLFYCGYLLLLFFSVVW